MINNSVTPASVAFPRAHKVSVAASFSPSGSIRVDAWGIEFGGKRFRYKVQETILLSEITAHMTFRCVYVEFGLLKSINLVFYLRTHSWTTE